MKKLVKNSVILLLIVIVINAMSYMLNNYLLDEAPFLVPDSIETLLMGDSNVTCGGDPSVVRNSLNISMAADAMFVSYIKLKNILSYKENRHLKNVVVSYSPLYYSGKIDSLMINDDSALDLFGRIHNYLDLSDFSGLGCNKSKLYSTYYRYRMLPNVNYFKNYIAEKTEFMTKEYPFIEGFYPYKKMKYKEVDYRKKMERYFPSDKELYISEQMPRYVDSIARLANDHDIQLFFVTFPVNQEFCKLFPEKIIHASDSLKVSILEKYDNVYFHDFMDSLETLYFSDYLHLNKSGAEVVSEWIDQEIRAVGHLITSNE